MNILIITQRMYPDSIGGSERVVYEQGKILAGRGHRVVVVSPRFRDDLAPRETIDGMEVFRYGSPGMIKLMGQSAVDLRDGKRMIAARLAEEIFDSVILHHPYPAAAFFRLPQAKNLPNVYVFHASVWRELRLDRKYGSIQRSVLGKALGLVATPLFLVKTRRIERFALQSASRIAVLSDFSAGILRETYRVDESKISKIPGGVDLEAYKPHPNPDALRDRLGIPRVVPTVLTVRRLVPRMGIPGLVRAFARVRAEMPQARLIIGGDGPMRNKIEEEIKRNGLERNVRLLGFVPARDLPDLYAAVDLYVLPTIAYEGFGLTALEALASGTPVVGTPAGAIPEVLRPFDERLIASAVSDEALADSLLAYLRRSPGERVDSRRAARAYAERWTWDASVDALLTMIPPKLP